MKKVKIIFLSLLTLAFAGCKDYLDMVPEKDIITIESIFEVRSSALLFYNSCVNAMVTEIGAGRFAKDPSLLGGGEYTVGAYVRNPVIPSAEHFYLGNITNILDGNQNTNSPYSDLWTMELSAINSVGSVYAGIRYCNIFIENIDKVHNMTGEEKKAWKAEIKCMKAYYYFEMMKRYGPIVLVPKNIQTNADIEKMQVQRSPMDECFKEVVSLFDEAIPDLRYRDNMPADSRPFFNKEAACAMKAKVLLFAASPLFNGNEWYKDFKNADGTPLFNPAPDLNKWKLAAEAADEAVRMAETSGLDLVSGGTGQKTEKLNKIADIANSVIVETWREPEWLFAHRLHDKFNSRLTLPRYKVNGQDVNTFVLGCVSPHMGIVEMFYTENGLPIDKDKTWPYNNRYKMNRETNTEYIEIVDMSKDVLNLHLRREPRFYANIAADGNYWRFNNSNTLVTPYRNTGMGTEYDRFNDPAQPQNITGYWAKKYLAQNENMAYMPDLRVFPFVALRLADLYLMQAEAWNEYQGPSDKVYNAIDKVRQRAGVLPIRQAWSQYSTAPDEVLGQDGLREAIHRERMIELVFEGHHAWDLRRWRKAHLYLSTPQLGWNVMGTDARSFYNNFEEPSTVWSKVQFIAPRDYFWPISSEETMIANIKQNPGW